MFVISGQSGPYNTSKPGGYGRNTYQNQQSMSLETPEQTGRFFETLQAKAGAHIDNGGQFDPTFMQQMMAEVKPSVRFSPAQTVGTEAYYQDAFGYAEEFVKNADTDNSKDLDWLEFKTQFTETLQANAIQQGQFQAVAMLPRILAEGERQEGRTFTPEERAEFSDMILKDLSSPEAAEEIRNGISALVSETAIRQAFEQRDINQNGAVDVVEAATVDLLYQDDSHAAFNAFFKNDIERIRTGRPLEALSEAEREQIGKLEEAMNAQRPCNSVLDGMVSPAEAKCAQGSLTQVSYVKRVLSHLISSNNLYERYNAFKA